MHLPIIAILALLPNVAHARISGTSVDLKKCKTIKNDTDILYSLAICPGLGQWKLVYESFNNRDIVSFGVPSGDSPFFRPNKVESVEIRYEHHKDNEQPFALITTYRVSGKAPSDKTDLWFLVSAVTSYEAGWYTCAAGIVEGKPPDAFDRAIQMADALKERHWKCGDDPEIVSLNPISREDILWMTAYATTTAPAEPLPPKPAATPPASFSPPALPAKPTFVELNPPPPDAASVEAPARLRVPAPAPAAPPAVAPSAKLRCGPKQILRVGQHHCVDKERDVSTLKTVGSLGHRHFAISKVTGIDQPKEKCPANGTFHPRFCELGWAAPLARTPN
jgi:hypothetical protein